MFEFAGVGGLLLSFACVGLFAALDWYLSLGVMCFFLRHFAAAALGGFRLLVLLLLIACMVIGCRGVNFVSWALCLTWVVILIDCVLCLLGCDFVFIKVVVYVITLLL